MASESKINDKKKVSSADQTPEELAAEIKAIEAELAKPQEIADTAFLLTCDDDVVPDKEAVKASLMKDIEERAMLPFYRTLCAKHGWPVDAALVKKLQEANAAELEKLEADIKDAEENLGQHDVLDAMNAKAAFFFRIGAKEKVFEANASIPPKFLSKGQKIDVALMEIRVAFFHMDITLASQKIKAAKTLIEEGGDWDRRNRLKVYEAAFAVATRDFEKASQLFLDSIATFTCVEMFSYKTLILYTVAMSVLCLDRVTLKKRVIDSPDVLTVILEDPQLSRYLNALYDCDYRGFFDALVEMHSRFLRHRYIALHVPYYVREMRIKAYSQFLDSYLSVTVDSMSTSFGVSSAFIDRELAQFIASGRINAKVNKVDGIIETNRPDQRNAQYRAVVKHGDALLNRIQHLARVVSL